MPVIGQNGTVTPAGRINVPVPAPNSLDPVDHLLLDELGDLPPGRIAVLEDGHGGLAAALADRTTSGVVAHSDSLVSEHRLIHPAVEVVSESPVGELST